MFKDRRYGLASFPARYDPRNPINRDPYNPQLDFSSDVNWDPTRFTNQVISVHTWNNSFFSSSVSCLVAQKERSAAQGTLPNLT